MYINLSTQCISIDNALVNTDNGRSDDNMLEYSSNEASGVQCVAKIMMMTHVSDRFTHWESQSNANELLYIMSKIDKEYVCTHTHSHTFLKGLPYCH